MSREYVKLVEREESALFVSLISRGFQREHFVNALDWDYGVEHHRYADRRHCISVEDRSAAREAILAGLDRQADFWATYIGRCNVAGKTLIATASELGAKDWRGADRSELAAGFARFADATLDMVPFLMATVAVQPILETHLVEALAGELPGPDADARAQDLLPALLVPSEKPDAVREIRNVQRLAAEAAAEPGLRELIEGADGSDGVVAEIQTGYPAFHAAATAHLDEFGWLRTHGYRFEPLGMAELLARVGGAIGRGGVPPVDGSDGEDFDVEAAIGFSPSPDLARLIGQLAELIHLRFYRIDVHLQADCTARPMFNALAAGLGCTRDELIFASVDELRTALEEGIELDIEELRRRATNWFELQRDGEQLSIRSLDAPLPGTVDDLPLGDGLAGMTASSGFASGPAKVLFGASEVGKVGRGDVLVTTMTTPDLMLAIENAAAIVTDEGGILSHAAIISRELRIPCVIGTETATRSFADGQLLEVDATQREGRVRPVGEAY